jgi:predicted enzyme related to lactoylglutathione lyase
MSKFSGNAITWFEIPTTNVQRAVAFYEVLLDRKLVPFGGEEPTYMFPIGPDAVGGALVQSRGVKPAVSGTMVYLNVDGQMDAVLKRAHAMEGTVQLPKTMIPGGHGYYACIRDTEGNHVGLHSRD